MARREYTVRVRTRSFIFGTVLLVLGVAIIAFLPVIIRYIDRSVTEKVAVYVTAPDLASDPVVTLAGLLNPEPVSGQASTSGPPDFTVSRVTDLAAARAATEKHDYAAVLAVGRDPTGELRFTLYSNQNATGTTVGGSVAVADDWTIQLGVVLGDQSPAKFTGELEKVTIELK